jgi:hypothetical protein
MIGILAADDAFEVLCGDAAIGGRRHLDAAAVEVLEGFARRYYELLKASQAAAGLLALGRELYRWIDGDGGQLTALLVQAPPPLRFEVCAANRYPSPSEWALLRAPWELLADQNGFLAADIGLGFSPVRRLGRQVLAAPLDRHRLGLVFMAASPRGAGAWELDYEAEETAIMAAVGSTKLDLLVEESGNPDELGERLNEYAAMQALHLSCHGHNAWRPADRPNDNPKPVLLLEDAEGEQLPTDAGALIDALLAHRPQLVFLSACLTAAAAGKRGGWLPGDKEGPQAGLRQGVAHSLAEALVNAGCRPCWAGMARWRTWRRRPLRRSSTIAWRAGRTLRMRSLRRGATCSMLRRRRSAGTGIWRGYGSVRRAAARSSAARFGAR